MNPNIWGPSFWKTIHYTAFSYPINPTEINKKILKNLYIL